MSDEQPRSAQDLVRYLRGRGISTAEIAAELQRSPRMVNKILNGETSGALYRGTLEELATTGRVTTVPARRRSASGQLVRVRAKAGAEEKSVVPVDTGGRYAGEKQGGRFQMSTTYLAGGGRQHELRIPKGKSSKGRQQAEDAIMQAVRAASKGQSHDKQKMVRATLTYGNGRVMEVNTYNASTMLQRIREAGGKPLDWMRKESGLRYSNLDVSEQPITGVTVTVFEQSKTRDYERNKARGRGRITRTLTEAEQLRKKALEQKPRRRGRGGRG